MTEYLDLSVVEPMTESITLSQTLDLPPTQEVLSEATATSPTTSCEGSTNTHLPLWLPSEPQFTKAIAQYYGVSRKAVQQWFQKVKTVCPWLTEADLKAPDGRYTPLCIELMGDYRLSGLPLEAWKLAVWERNSEHVERYFAAQSPPSSLPAINTPSADSVPIQVMGIEQLQAHQQHQSHVLSLREQTTQALTDANQVRLAQLKDFFLHQQQQRQLDHTQRYAQLEAEAQNEAIEEFLIKQQAKNAVLSQLEQMNTLGKFTPQERPSPST